jgi:hypothetical protein
MFQGVCEEAEGKNVMYESRITTHSPLAGALISTDDDGMMLRA